jgi:hypothetical protein
MPKAEPEVGLSLTPLFKKLNLKSHREIVVLAAPSTFEAELVRLAGVRVHRSADDINRIAFALAFVMTQQQLDAASRDLASKAEADAILWFAYPKSASKRYRCDFNRDTGWNVLGTAGWEAVRNVSIDEDWSAIRFRRTVHIKRFRRDASRATSPAEKARAARG